MLSDSNGLREAWPLKRLPLVSRQWQRKVRVDGVHADSQDLSHRLDVVSPNSLSFLCLGSTAPPIAETVSRVKAQRPRSAIHSRVLRLMPDAQAENPESGPAGDCG